VGWALNSENLLRLETRLGSKKFLHYLSKNLSNQKPHRNKTRNHEPSLKSIYEAWMPNDGLVAKFK
jgi:hypothetical protein